MQKGIFLQDLNIKSGTVNNAIITLGDIDDSGKGRKFVSKFIQPGLVKIEGHGIVLLRKETLDESLPTIVGSPVIIQHKDVTEENANELRCGVIANAYFNQPDGWYYVDGIIWDDKAQELINKGWSVSCSYDYLAFNDEGGEENNIHYDKEFTQLNFTHLAIVDNPRYERANIVFNSKVKSTEVNNEDQWITIHPNGKDAKGKHLLLKDGETPKEAIDRVYKKEDKKEDKKQFDTKDDKEETKKEYPSRHAEILYKDLPELREKLHKAKYERAKNKEKGADVSLYDKRIKEYEDKEQQLKDEMAELRDNRRSQKERYTSLIEEQKQPDTKDKQSDSKGDLDIKKTTVKMKSGKEKEIEYVDSVPEGYKKLEGAMTAPLGYTWYHNGKSIIDKERKTILVKDKVNNNKEQDMALLDELKKLIFKVENNKENETMVENEKVDKRKLIDEVGGILKGKVDDEVIRTIIGKMEKMSYDDSEASADNKKVKNEADEEDKKVDNEEDKKEEDKKVDNEDEEDEEKVEELKKEEKKDVDNKCKNSKEENYFDKLNKIYNSAKKIEEPSADYESKQARLDAGKEYFG